MSLTLYCFWHRELTQVKMPLSQAEQVSPLLYTAWPSTLPCCAKLQTTMETLLPGSSLY